MTWTADGSAELSDHDVAAMRHRVDLTALERITSFDPRRLREDLDAVEHQGLVASTDDRLWTLAGAP